MKFESNINEKLLIASITPEQDYDFTNQLESSLSIIWNIGKKSTFIIDGRKNEIGQNCLFFLTEFHKVENFSYEKLNVLQFNRAFHCINEHDAETGCKGLLFFGAASVPKIIIPKGKLKVFTLIWEVFILEMEENDVLKIEMLRALLKRFLILSLRIYKRQNKDIPTDDSNISILREFNYLVETNYKQLTKVADYANLLYKSPKTLSNVFNKIADRTPLQIINDRRILEARRLLTYTDFSIQEIAEELNFADIQSFSSFFRKRETQSPSQFRKSVQE